MSKKFEFVDIAACSPMIRTALRHCVVLESDVDDVQPELLQAVGEVIQSRGADIRESLLQSEPNRLDEVRPLLAMINIIHPDTPVK
ncbi:MAG: hypothetical protein JWL89_469 [Candidatus Saccharibacteria bacterium]|nr:hypothetical protein [Candidatus Saccharibacteria bacterium]